MARIVIAGGTGFAGTLLARHFFLRGDQVTVLGRYPKPREWTAVHWTPPDAGDWSDVLEEADAVILMAGRSLQGRDTARNRRDALRSRVDSMNALAEAIRSVRTPPRRWVCMTQIPGDGFSAEIAEESEARFWAQQTPVERMALRCGLVMSVESGGLFPWLLRAIRYGLMGRCGDGSQSVSWLHEHDFARGVESALTAGESSATLCAPGSLSNAEFIDDLRRAWNPLKLSVPYPRWLFEATGIRWPLESASATPSPWLAFSFPEWPAAASDLVQRIR